MKGIVIYKGKYGATGQYAKWLGQDLQIPVVSSQNISGENLKLFDYLLIGTSVYIGKLQIAKWLNENCDIIAGKKIFFFQVAATPAGNLKKRMSYYNSGIPSVLLTSCEFFFLDGKMSVKDLSWRDRFLLKMGARFTKDPVEKKAMLTDFDKVKKVNLEDLLANVFEFLHPAPVNACQIPAKPVMH